MRRALVLAALAANAATLIATSQVVYIHRSAPLTAPFALDPDSPTVALTAEVRGDDVYHPAVVVSVRADNADGAPPGGVSVWATADGQEPVEILPNLGLAEVGAGPASLAVTYFPFGLLAEEAPARVTFTIDLVGDSELTGEVLVYAETVTVREFDDPVHAEWVTP